MLACFLIAISLGIAGCIHVHPAPMFNLGNNFPETVTVYFNGHNVGQIKSGETKITWPNEIAKAGDLLIEFKSKSGGILFSKTYTMDDIFKIVEEIHAGPFWIGPLIK